MADLNSGATASLGSISLPSTLHVNTIESKTNSISSSPLPISQCTVPSSTQSTKSASPSPTRMRGVDKKAPSLRRPQAVVKILIGPSNSVEQETFYVHKDLLCHYSSFFSTAFTNPQFVEFSAQCMTLPDLSTDDFGAFVQWLYTQRLELDVTNRDANLLFLARFWTLAQRFHVTKLQNKIMDKLRPLSEAAEKGILKSFIDYVYEDGDEKHELRKLAADRMAWGTTQAGLGAWMMGGHIPSSMLVDIVLSLKKEHVPGKPTVRHFFGEAKDYYVNSSNKEEVKGEAEDRETV